MKARLLGALWLAAAALAPLSARAAAPEAPSPAAGKSRPPVEEARERFNRGVQLFHEGSLEAALAEFQRAYELAPSYRLHYNLAQVQYELHDYVGALRSFWKYLAQGGNEVAASRRHDVEAEIRRLEKRVGFLTIKAGVDGAQISVDGVPMGISPFSAPVLVNPGIRRITASKMGHQSAQNTVTLAGGERTQVTLHMPASYGGDGLSLLPRRSPFEDPPGRKRVWMGLGATVALATSSTIFAIVAKNAETSFEREISLVPNDRATIDGARDRMKRYAAVTDVLLGATAIAAAATIYLTLIEDRPLLEPSSGRSIAVGPDGLALRF